MAKNEVILEKGNNFVTRYGSTIEEARPAVVYLRTKSKITPLVEQKAYDNEINFVKEKFSEFVKRTIRQYKTLQNTYLFNVDISAKNMRYGRVSFLRYDIYVKPYRKRTLEENMYRMRQLSLKLDKRLEQLLNSRKITCVQ